MYFTPLYELVYPCLKNRSPSIFMSAGIGAAAVVISSLYGVIAEVMRQAVTNGPIECMLAQMVPDSHQYSCGVNNSLAF